MAVWPFWMVTPTPAGVICPPPRKFPVPGPAASQMPKYWIARAAPAPPPPAAWFQALVAVWKVIWFTLVTFCAVDGVPAESADQLALVPLLRSVGTETRW